MTVPIHVEVPSPFTVEVRDGVFTLYRDGQRLTSVGTERALRLAIKFYEKRFRRTNESAL